MSLDICLFFVILCNSKTMKFYYSKSTLKSEKFFISILRTIAFGINCPIHFVEIKKPYKVGYLYQSVADKTGTPILKITYLGKNFYNLDIQ